MTNGSTFILAVCMQAITMTALGQQLTKASPNPPAATSTTLNQQSYIFFADQETALMTKRLNLDKRQQIQIASLNYTYYKSAAIILQDRKTPSTRKSRIDQLRENRNNTLGEILLPGQYKLFEKAMAESKARSDENTKKLNELEFSKRRRISKMR